MGVHHWRFRKTGPSHRLAVVKCYHGPAFTLYPPGYGPYKRISVAPLSGTGEVVSLGADGDISDARIGVYMRTVHVGAIDAFFGERWSRESPVGDFRRRRTQDRYMNQSSILLGLSPALEENVVEEIAESLRVPALRLLDLRAEYGSAATYGEKGIAIVNTLLMVPVDRTIGHRFLMSGFIGGLWGRPGKWDPG